MAYIYDINAQQYCLSSLDLQIAGNTIFGGSELKISEKLTPGEVEGQSAVPVGWTKGPWSGEGSIKLPLGEALTLKAAMGNEWMTQAWTGTATFTELSGPGVMTIEILGARFNTTSLDGGDRSKASTDALDFTLLTPCIANGVKAVEPVSSGGLGGLSISFSL
jgi:hypothetical protein